VNADLIEHIEVTPDTIVALTTGQKFMVLESAEEVVERVVQFRRGILNSREDLESGLKSTAWWAK
jgi:flagellar protein FlbD